MPRVMLEYETGEPPKGKYTWSGSPRTVKEKTTRVMMTLRDDILRVWAQATLRRWSVGRCPR